MKEWCKDWLPFITGMLIVVLAVSLPIMCY